MANHKAIPTSLRYTLETTFLTTTDLFNSPLNCSMSDNITYCSVFPKDVVFGAVLNSFHFRWTISYIANPEYEPEDMLTAIIHALASSECSDTPFLVILTFPVWDDTPWNSTSIRGHRNMTTLLRIPTGYINNATTLQRIFPQPGDRWNSYSSPTRRSATHNLIDHEAARS